VAIIIVEVFDVRFEASLEQYVERRAADLELNTDDDGAPIYTPEEYLSIFVRPGADAQAIADELGRQKRTMLRVVEIR
jgi:hypothetical protein